VRAVPRGARASPGEEALGEGGDEGDLDGQAANRCAGCEACGQAKRRVTDLPRQADAGYERYRMVGTTVGSVRMKEVNEMLRRPNSGMYHSALSFKWLVGLVLMLVALYAYVVNHASLLEAATLFGIGVILA
jgi:hypothetical protein